MLAAHRHSSSGPRPARRLAPVRASSGGANTRTTSSPAAATISAVPKMLPRPASVVSGTAAESRAWLPPLVASSHGEAGSQESSGPAAALPDGFAVVAPEPPPPVGWLLAPPVPVVHWIGPLWSHAG